MEIVCTYCRKPFVQSVRRQGLGDRLLSLFYSYPFRCQVCRHRFHLLQWGFRYTESQVDRREYQRRPVRTSIKLLDEHGKPVGIGTVTDLSVGGCSIETANPMPVGTLLELKIEAFDEQPAITVERAIVRSTRSSSSRGSGVGVEFLRFGSEESRLSDYMLSLWIQGTQIARKGQLEEAIAFESSQRMRKREAS